MKEEIEKRIAHIQSAVEQSIANHNALLGRLEEAKHCLSLLEEAANAANEVIDAVVGE